jgi:SP family myo-inositol transporter-like MFS transporter 13
MYYSSTLFGIVGFSNPVAVGTIIAGTNFIFTWSTSCSLTVSGVGESCCAQCGRWLFSSVLPRFAFHWIPVNHDLTLVNAKVGWPADVVLICMVFYVAFYLSGMGNTAWLSSEFFPMEIRALGTMMLTCTCWGSNVIVASTFLTQMENTTLAERSGFMLRYASSDGSQCTFVIRKSRA